MRRVFVHYPTVHPRLTWLCVTVTAINNIPIITLVALCMQYAKLLFQSCFSCTQPFISFVSCVMFFCGISVSALSALISQM